LQPWSADGPGIPALQPISVEVWTRAIIYEVYVRDGALVDIVRVVADRRHGEVMMTMKHDVIITVIIVIIISPGIKTLRRTNTYVRPVHAHTSK